MRLFVAFVAALGLASAVWGQAHPAPKAQPPQRWIHWMGNLATDQGMNHCLEIMKRGAAAGYTGMAIIDTKFEKFHLYDESYYANVRKVRQAFTENNMQLIVGIGSFGYSAEMLTHDPNLAEGMPVVNAPFVVKDGKLVPDDPITLRNGSFEQYSENVARGWTGSDPGVVTFVDDQVKHDGNVSIRIENPGAARGHGRVGQRIPVKPFQYYHLSAWVKTEEWKGRDNRYGALGGDNTQWCTWMPPAIKETMDWTQLHAVFNTLNNTEVTIYFGTWGGRTGKMWIDDIRIEPAGFVNIIRRDSAPLVVKGEDGTIYKEGVDFTEVKDPKLLHDPNPGYFTIWHDVPAVTIPQGSALKEGQKVLVSYEHIMTGSKPHQINACYSEPMIYEIFAKQIAWLKETANPDMYFLQHDEIRHLGWDNACASTGKTPGQILADNISKCVAIIEHVDPGKPVFVWNDMFDPHHNARKTDADGRPFIMYLAKGEGPWYGSWEGMPEQLGVINWNGNNDESVSFFSGRGQQQILSHNNPERIVQWLKTSGQKKGVVGVMFTNWERDYSKLEAYIEAVKAWEKEAGFKQ